MSVPTAFSVASCSASSFSFSSTASSSTTSSATLSASFSFPNSSTAQRQARTQSPLNCGFYATPRSLFTFTLAINNLTLYQVYAATIHARQGRDSTMIDRFSILYGINPMVIRFFMVSGENCFFRLCLRALVRLRIVRELIVCIYLFSIYLFITLLLGIKQRLL